MVTQYVRFKVFLVRMFQLKRSLNITDFLENLFPSFFFFGLFQNLCCDFAQLSVLLLPDNLKLMTSENRDFCRNFYLFC
jgi:hypothetical protein